MEEYDTLTAEKEENTKKKETEPKVHYNSKEPEKFEVKALTKNGEVHLSPSADEETLAHELAHVYQQLEGRVKPTGEIGGQKVNTDPALEKEADEIAAHIEDYIPEIISENGSKTTDVVQFNPHTETELQMYAELGESAESAGIDTAEFWRILGISETLKTKEIFPKASLISVSTTISFNLNLIMQ